MTSHGLGLGYEPDDNAAVKIHTRKGSPTGSKRGPAMLRRYRGRGLKPNPRLRVSVWRPCCDAIKCASISRLPPISVCLNVVCAAGALPPEVQAFVTETNTPVGHHMYIRICIYREIYSSLISTYYMYIHLFPDGWLHDAFLSPPLLMRLPDNTPFPLLCDWMDAGVGLLCGDDL
jgi:hypothetical protein